MSASGETEWVGTHGNPLYSVCIFSINLKLFQHKNLSEKAILLNDNSKTNEVISMQIIWAKFNKQFINTYFNFS